MWHAQKMMSLLGDPVGRVHQQYVRLLLLEITARSLVRPTQLLPAALRASLVLWRIFAIDQMRRVGREIARDDLPLMAVFLLTFRIFIGSIYKLCSLKSILDD